MGKLITILAVVLGWALNEMSSSLRLRREDRRAAGPLLADLLEIRHRLFALDTVIGELGKQLLFPAQVSLQLKQFFAQLMPEAPKFAERYEDAVAQVARASPILAFRLRGQCSVDPVLSQLRALVAPDQAASTMWQSVIEPAVFKRLTTHLDKLILDVAWVHGPVTWFRTRRRLKRPLELTQADKEWISSLVSAFQTPPAVPQVGPSP